MDLLEGNIPNPISHWYYLHKFQFIKKFIESPINLCDIGAGSALFSLELANTYDQCKFLAVDTNYPIELEGKSERNLTYSRNLNNYSFQYFLLTDVLEHIEDDLDFLKNIVERSPAESIFIITVPCFNSLWSGHDVFLKHFRRYNKNSILKLSKLAGLEVTYFQYLYCALFIPVLVLRNTLYRNRTSSQLRDSSMLINSFLKFLCKLDFSLGRLTPFGLSCIVIAKKSSFSKLTN